MGAIKEHYHDDIEKGMREASEVVKCKTSDWSCIYHACISDDCQERFMKADAKRLGPGKCKTKKLCKEQ